jgi:hypothetical protein
MGQPTHQSECGGFVSDVSFLQQVRPVKTQDIVQRFGEGGLALVVGSVLLGIGLAQALVALFPDLAVWGAYMIVGGIALVAGGVLLSTGAEAAEHKVERVEDKIEDAFDIKKQIAARPFMATGAAIAAGFLLSKILPGPKTLVTGKSSAERHRLRAEERAEEAEQRYEDYVASRQRSESQSENKSRDQSDGWGDLFNEQVADIGDTIKASAIGLFAHMIGPNMIQSMLGGLGFDDDSSSHNDHAHSERRKHASASNGHGRH